MPINPGCKSSNKPCKHCGKLIYYKNTNCMDCRRNGRDAKDRLLKKVYFTDNCWIWMGGRNNKGYGYFYYRGVHMNVHRASYQIFNETILGDLHVLHKCNNPTCVNPKHLYAGTHKDNMRDLANSDRAVRGETHPQAKLNYKKVALIRLLSKQGLSQSVLSQRFSIHQSQISRIVHNRSWT